MLSKTSTQVINAFVELARLDKDQFAGAVNIADKIKAPKNYLGKMLQSFSYRGLLVSQKGSGGGFQLAKEASKISLYDIVEPIENISIWSECALGMKRCSQVNPCAVHDRWSKVRDVYYQFLKTTYISDLV
ncbi:MAG: Rrf2 family transcriptional regulator [Candidatus Omnitrophota bacterium]